MIRKIELKDRDQWEKLYRGYADFYKVEMNNQILKTVWGWLHDKSHEVSGIVYEVYFEGDKSKNYENVFVPGDAASHLNLPSRVIFIKKAFDKLDQLFFLFQYLIPKTKSINLQVNCHSFILRHNAAMLKLVDRLG